MHYLKRTLGEAAFFILLLAVPLSGAATTSLYSDLTDYQRMSWLFYHHNRDTIAISAAANHFGKLHVKNTVEPEKCAQIRQFAQDKSFDVQEFYRDEFYLLQDAINPAQLSDHFTTTVSISNAYDSFDTSSRSLTLKGFDQIPSHFIVDSSQENNMLSNQNPCDIFFESQSATNANIITPIPGSFKMDFYRALQKAIIDNSHLTQLPEIQSSVLLQEISINENQAIELLNRPLIDRNMDILINYRFQSRRPHHETDASGRRNTLIHTSYESVDYSLPTHSIDIQSITYIDKLTGDTLNTISFENSQPDTLEPSHRNQIQNGSKNSHKSPTVLPDTKLPQGLRIFEDAIVVRNDDLVLHKTPSENRLALTILNQQLALSAGLPDFTDPENGIYIADALGDRAAEYFSLSDIRTVQPQTYNLLVKGSNHELSVVTKWREDISKTRLLESFKRNEVPYLENFALSFPISFVELREVLVQPYDSNIGGFPLLYINGNSYMRLNDLRKPTINLDAQLTETLPQYWKLKLPEAELFIEHYYQYHLENDDRQTSGILKRIILASRYMMLSVKARNNTVIADMKIQQRRLYLGDQLTHMLDELPIHLDN